MNETYAQRMRVTFATDDTVKWVGHLDFARAWERAIRRAGLPLAYSQGFNAQARIHFAAALPVSFTGQAEVVDVFLNEELAPEEFLARLQAALPTRIRLTGAEPVPRALPSLQSALVGADYRVEVAPPPEGAGLAERLEGFMARAEAWRERQRGDKPPVRYDLRPLVTDARHLGTGELGELFEVRMRSEPGATGRPDELLAELGLADAPRRIVRTALRFGPDTATDGLRPSG